MIPARPVPGYSNRYENSPQMETEVHRARFSKRAPYTFVYLKVTQPDLLTPLQLQHQLPQAANLCQALGNFLKDGLQAVHILVSYDFPYTGTWQLLNA